MPESLPIRPILAPAILTSSLIRKASQASATKNSSNPRPLNLSPPLISDENLAPGRFTGPFTPAIWGIVLMKLRLDDSAVVREVATRCEKSRTPPERPSFIRFLSIPVIGGDFPSKLNRTLPGEFRISRPGTTYPLHRWARSDSAPAGCILLPRWGKRVDLIY
jgi:hypothetical protein